MKPRNEFAQIYFIVDRCVKVCIYGGFIGGDENCHFRQYFCLKRQKRAEFSKNVV